MPDPTRRAATTNSVGGVSSFTLTVPAGTTAGDGQLISVTTSNPTTGRTVTTPSGWTIVDSVASTSHGGYETRHYTFKRRASSEGTVTITMSGNAESAVGERVTYRDVKSTGDFVGASSQNSGNSQTTTATGITLTGRSLLYFMGVDWWGAGGLSPPSGMTERHDVGGLYVAEQASMSAGATGNKTQTNSNTDAAQPFVARLVEILAEPAGGRAPRPRIQRPLMKSLLAR